MRKYILPLGLLLLMFSCRPQEDTSSRPVITVSILPQKYFVERLAGDLAEVNVMVPPAASPATYEPTVSQLNRLARSSVYFRLGYLGFEMSWFDKIKASGPDMKVVDISGGIETITEEGYPDNHGSDNGHDHGHGTVDPHIWMSVENVRVISGQIHRELLLQFPEAREELDQRYARWMEELDSLHRAISRNLEELESRSFMIYHPALTYFAHDYNLEQYPLELGGKTPSPAQMKRMVDLGREKGISIIFIQKQFDQSNATVLASEIGAEIVQIDPLDPEWMDQMIYISDRIKSSQQ